MTLLSGLHSHRSTEQQAEIREARRMLQGRVRTDWDYPALPQYQKNSKPRQQQDDESKVAGFKFHAPRADEHFEPLEWRERDYASSDADSEEDENEIAAVKAGSEKSLFSGTQKSKDIASVAEDVSNRRLARKRKRKELLEEEMQWNDGLNHWTIQRDAWCVAKTAEQVREFESRQGEEVKTDSASTSVSVGSTPRTSTSSASAQAASTSTSATSPDANTTVAGLPVASPSHMLVPVMAKILPHHPVRKKISPAMYPEIYNKIIVQARTPSVPINLSVMIWALVQGWIDDGEWPPKPGPIEKSLTKKKSGGVKQSFARILRITSGDSTVAKG
jgi:hypothetical protein